MNVVGWGAVKRFSQITCQIDGDGAAGLMSKVRGGACLAAVRNN